MTEDERTTIGEVVHHLLNFITVTLTLLALIAYLVIVTYTNNPTIPFYAH